MLIQQKYIPLVYSKRVNCKKAYIYLMQYEFIPAEVNHTNLNVYSADKDGVEAIKEMVRENSNYYERLNKIVIDDDTIKPSPKADWNEYAIQRLLNNDLLEYDNVIIAYSTMYNDIITIRM